MHDIVHFVRTLMDACPVRVSFHVMERFALSFFAHQVPERIKIAIRLLARSSGLEKRHFTWLDLEDG